MNNNYVLLYGNKKPEDNICIPFMFDNTLPIPLGWIEKDRDEVKKIIDNEMVRGVKQIIFWGLEIGWDIVVKDIKKAHNDIKIKVVCNTSDSLLYYDYERENFFKLLNLSKHGFIDEIAFLRRGMYLTYKNLGYKCSYILENIKLDCKDILSKKNNKNDKINIGIYPLNYTWDKNIFNQLSVGKIINNSIINYNLLDGKMKEFLEIMSIQSNIDKIEKMDACKIANIIVKNDINISCNFTDYVHPIPIISMECEVPCIIGNNSELFSEELKEYLVVHSEDNPIRISEKINIAIKNKEAIIEKYKKWKESYDINSKKSIEIFINK